MNYITLEGTRRRAEFDCLATGEHSNARIEAERGSAMLLDAILRSMGIEQPKPAPRPKADEPICVLCPVCDSPIAATNLMIVHIQKVVADYYGLDHKNMVSAQRHTAVAHPRQVAIYLCSELTYKSYSEIGRRFGGRDHTTVIYACKTVKKRIETDPEIQLDVEILREKLAA